MFALGPRANERCTDKRARTPSNASYVLVPIYDMSRLKRDGGWTYVEWVNRQPDALLMSCGDDATYLGTGATWLTSYESTMCRRGEEYARPVLHPGTPRSARLCGSLHLPPAFKSQSVFGP